MPLSDLIRIQDHLFGAQEWVGTFGPGFAEKIHLDTFAYIDDSLPLRFVLGEDEDKSPWEIDIPASKKKLRPYEQPKPAHRALHSLRPGEQNVCRACEDVEIRRLLQSPQGIHYELGWFNDIKQCQDCSLCRLITHAFEATIDNKTHVGLTDDDSQYFVILECLNMVTPVPTLRRDRACELVAMLLAPSGRTGHFRSRARIRPLASTTARIGKSSMYHARLIDSFAANLDLARGWIAECCKTHDCETAGRFEDGQENLPEPTGPEDEDSSRNGTARMEASNRMGVDARDGLRVIDVKKACLTVISRSDRYVALSYVWPRFDSPRLLISNRKELHTRGALRALKSKLPRVIRDAMDVVTDLRESYLWVDALCITQDDDREKVRLINIMNQVYGRAFLTLVVATATSPTRDYGIPGCNGTVRTARQFVENLEGLDMVTALPNLDEALESSIWSRRGWTFQEGILSKRCLIFTDQQLFFRCTKDARSEDVVAEGSPSGMNKHPAKPELRVGQIDYITNQKFLRNTDNDHALHEYSLLVSAYSQRNFTVQEDILNGFTGIMTSMLPSFPMPQGFFAGIPTHIFDQAILWYPTGPLERRETALVGGVEMRVPSWSWVGWKGKVAYENYPEQMSDWDAVRIMVQWWRAENGTLVPLRNYGPSIAPEYVLSHGLLVSQARSLQPMQLIFWASCPRFSIGKEEHSLREWVTDWRQVLPCFVIWDENGDACGMLPSADRTWAERHKTSTEEGKAYEFVLLSYTSSTEEAGTTSRLRYFHPKYDISVEAGQRRYCFYNVMLIEYDDDGIAYRRGIGRVHVDAANRQLDTMARKAVVLG